MNMPDSRLDVIVDIAKRMARFDALEEAARAITKHWRGIKSNKAKDSGPHWAATLVRSLKSKP